MRYLRAIKWLTKLFPENRLEANDFAFKVCTYETQRSKSDMEEGSSDHQIALSQIALAITLLFFNQLHLS